MDVIIIMVLRTSASDIKNVADAIYTSTEKMVNNINLNIGTGQRVNSILKFEASELRPNSTVTRFFKFPNDLDTIKPQSNESNSQ